jgi:hypothetical protein
MPIPTTEKELVRLFRTLGVEDPEGYARSELGGNAQVLRVAFLKLAWSRIVAEGDSSWIDALVRVHRSKPNEPYAGLGQALARCREKGVSDADLIEIARCLQAEMLFSIGYILGDASDLEFLFHDETSVGFVVEGDLRDAEHDQRIQPAANDGEHQR